MLTHHDCCRNLTHIHDLKPNPITKGVKEASIGCGSETQLMSRKDKFYKRLLDGDRLLNC